MDTSISYSASVFIICIFIVTGDVLDYCLNESFNVSCPVGKFVLIVLARFGRMRPGRCIGGDFNIGCANDVKGKLKIAKTNRLLKYRLAHEHRHSIFAILHFLSPLGRSVCL